MARRKDSPQKAAMREMMRDYLKNNDISIKDGTDVNSIMRDMIMNKRMYKILSAMKVEYYGAAEPLVRCGESHLSGLTEPLHFVY